MQTAVKAPRASQKKWHRRDARTAENKDKIFVWNCKVRLKETMQAVVQDAIGNDHESSGQGIQIQW